MHRACNALKQIPKGFVSSKLISRSIFLRQPQLLIRSNLYQDRSSGVTTLSIRSYSNKSRIIDKRKKGAQTSKGKQSDGGTPGAPPEVTLEMLESTARALKSWNTFPEDHKSRLKLANALVHQVFLYVFRPHDPDQANTERFCDSLMFTPVGPNTETQRARDVIAIIIRAAVDCLSTIPLDSNARKHSAVFEVVDILTKLKDEYMGKDGQVENWVEFWSGAQFGLLHLGKALDEAGYGYPRQPAKGSTGRKVDQVTEKQELTGDTPQMLLEALESAASAPWLKKFPEDHEDRLDLASCRLYPIFIYLAVPKTDSESVRRHQVDFTEAPARPDLDPEIVRARKAIAIVTRGVVDCLSTIPMESEARTKYSSVFEMLPPLVELRNTHLVDEGGRVEDWAKFWREADGRFLSLGMKLDRAGFDRRPTRRRKSDF